MMIIRRGFRVRELGAGRQWTRAKNRWLRTQVRYLIECNRQHQMQAQSWAQLLSHEVQQRMMFCEV